MPYYNRTAIPHKDHTVIVQDEYYENEYWLYYFYNMPENPATPYTIAIWRITKIKNNESTSANNDRES
jgi:hypothetical protein